MYTVPDVGDDSWGLNLTNYFVAIPQGALQKSGGTFTLSADVDFGGTYGLLSSYFETRGSNPSSSGLVRLNLTDTIAWRNNANTSDLALAINGTDQLTFNGAAIFPGGITALTGDVTATGPGSVAATIGSNKVLDTMIRQSAGLSLIGRATNSTGNVADITASVSNGVLTSTGSALTFALLTNSNIDPAAAIAYSKLALAASIVNSDISGSAAIAYSKLNLALSIVNADISASAAIAFSKLATLSSGNILVGSAGNVATSVAVTGDVTISNAGVTAIGSGKVTNTMIASSTIDLTTKVTGILPQANGGTGASTLGAGTVTSTGSTTARSLATRFAQVANVKDFGAVGNGSTDDTTAIQAAATSLTFGGTLYFPQGNYVVSSAITLIAGTLVSGVSAYAATITTSAAAANIFVVPTTCKIENMAFTCSTTATSGSYLNANGNFIIVNNCQFSKYFNAISLGLTTQSVNCSVNTSSFNTPSVQSGGGAILLNNFASFKLTGCAITGTGSGTQTDYGVEVIAGDTLLISDCNITAHGRALYVVPAVSNNIYALHAVNSLFDSAGTITGGTSVSSARFSATGNVYNTKFANCWFGLSTGGDGCAMTTTGGGLIDGIAFTGCQFVGNFLRGLYIGDSGVKNVTVTGGDSAGNTTAGIYAAAGVTYFTITGHRAGNVSARGANGYGIFVASGASDFYEISGNNVFGNTTAGISDSGTGSNKLIQGNAGYNAAAPTIQKFTSGSGTCTIAAGVQWFSVEMCGGGGGSGATGTGPTGGSSGGNTTFGTTLLSAPGGSKGAGTTGGAGGSSASLGTGPIGYSYNGVAGNSGTTNATAVAITSQGGAGGSTPGFGGGGSVPTGAAKTNSGSGGGGPSGNAISSGGGGGSGAYVKAIITPAIAAANGFSFASFAYAVGAAGSGETAGSGGNNGSNGAAGIIIVTEYY